MTSTIKTTDAGVAVVQEALTYTLTNVPAKGLIRAVHGEMYDPTNLPPRKFTQEFQKVGEVTHWIVDQLNHGKLALDLDQ